jgi:hypothetical protein
MLDEIITLFLILVFCKKKNALIQTLKKRLHQGIKYFVGPLTLLFSISEHPAKGWSPNIHLMCRRNQIFNC